MATVYCAPNHYTTAKALRVLSTGWASSYGASMILSRRSHCAILHRFRFWKIYFNARKFAVTPNDSFSYFLIQIAPLSVDIVGEFIIFVRHCVVFAFAYARL